MKNFSFIDETFDINRTNTYERSIQVSLNGFSLSILDLVRNKFILLKHYDLKHKSSFEEKADEIQSAIEKDEHLKAKYKKTKTLVVSPKSVLIPNELFDQNFAKKYFEFNHKLEELEEIHFNQNDSIQAVNLFTIPNPISNVLFDAFGKTPLYHQFNPFNAHHLRFHNENRIAAVYLYEDFIDFGVFGNQRLKFYNNFLIQSKEDILYFILYTFKQLELSRVETELYISGNLRLYPGLDSLLSQYIKRIHFQKPPKDFTYSYTFKKEQMNHFTNLFQLQLCE
ncbi:MAG: DUF3822 family protein [Bacteroidota bacterium]